LILNIFLFSEKENANLDFQKTTETKPRSPLSLSDYDYFLDAFFLATFFFAAFFFAAMRVSFNVNFGIVCYGYFSAAPSIILRTLRKLAALFCWRP